MTAEPGTPIFRDPETSYDPWRYADWDALPNDVCMIAGCEASEVDQRAPVFLRGGGMGKACTEHWEAIMNVLGDQAAWEREAFRSAV